MVHTQFWTKQNPLFTVYVFFYFQVGYSDFTVKNPRPHLWVRGKVPFCARMVRILHEFLETLTIGELAVIGTQRLRRDLQLVLTDFDGPTLGPEYVCLRPWDIIECWNPASGATSGGWEYGLNCSTGRFGWFPRTCARPCKR